MSESRAGAEHPQGGLKSLFTLSYFDAKLEEEVAIIPVKLSYFKMKRSPLHISVSMHPVKAAPKAQLCELLWL